MESRTPALRHAALFHRNSGEFASCVSDFVRAGVRSGEPVLVATSGPHLDNLRPRLDSLGGEVTWTGLSQRTNPGRVTAAMRGFADDHHGRHVRLVQEPVSQPGRPGHLHEAVRNDSLVNHALAGKPALVLCAYGAWMDRRIIACAERTHPAVLWDGRWQSNPLYTPGPALPAECDCPLPAPTPGAEVLHYRRNLSDVRQFAAGRAMIAGLSPDRVSDLMTAVGELAANTVAHTDGPGKLTVWQEDGEFLCQVQDRGHIADPLAGIQPPGTELTQGGLGLWVVHQLCDLAELRTGPAGTTIRLHMRLRQGH